MADDGGIPGGRGLGVGTTSLISLSKVADLNLPSATLTTIFDLTGLFTTPNQGQWFAFIFLKMWLTSAAGSSFSLVDGNGAIIWGFPVLAASVDLFMTVPIAGGQFGPRVDPCAVLPNIFKINNTGANPMTLKQRSTYNMILSRSDGPLGSP